MGGIALGKGVMSSGLLEVMDVVIRKLINGFSLYSVVLVLSPVVLVREILIRYPFSYMSNILLPMFFLCFFCCFPRSFPLSSVTQ